MTRIAISTTVVRPERKRCCVAVTSRVSISGRRGSCRDLLADGRQRLSTRRERRHFAQVISLDPMPVPEAEVEDGPELEPHAAIRSLFNECPQSLFVEVVEDRL